MGTATDRQPFIRAMDKSLSSPLRTARQALLLAQEELRFDAAHAIVRASGEPRVVSQALALIDRALSEIAAEVQS